MIDQRGKLGTFGKIKKLPGKITGKYLLKLITKGLINEGIKWSNLINLKINGSFRKSHLEIEKWK